MGGGTQRLNTSEDRQLTSSPPFLFNLSVVINISCHMNAVSEFDALGFSSYLVKPQTFILDLSKSTLLEVIDEMCRIKDVMSPRTTKNHSCLKNQLRGVERDFNITLMPNQVTDVFWNYFVSYMLNVNHLAISTIKTCCAQLRSALSWASRHNCKIAPSYDFVSLPKYNHEQIALTPDEVSHIYHFDLSTINRRSQYIRNMQRVRDHFVLSCSLGQRFSDMVRIDKSCFDRNIFSIMQVKTGAKCRVDIDKMSMDANTTYTILEKYGYKAPIQGDISAYDRYVKELLKYIGGEFNENVKRETKVNGMIETKFFPKYKLVSSHTCRRTFATINVLRGFHEAEIRRATGHKTSEAFSKYLWYFDD